MEGEDRSKGGVAFKAGAGVGDMISSSGEAGKQINASGMGSSTGVAGQEAEEGQAFKMAEALAPDLPTHHSQRAQSSCQTLEPPLELSLLKDSHKWCHLYSKLPAVLHGALNSVISKIVKANS